MAKKKKTTKKKTQKKTGSRAKKKASESHLSKADIKKYETLLLAKRTEILGDVSSMKEGSISNHRSELSNVPFHMADAGSDNYEMENTLGLMDEEVRILREIDAALARMEMGMYGICEGSGEPIPTARLDAIPWARYTVGFKEMLEKGLVTLDESIEESEDEEDDSGDIEDEEVVDEEAEAIDELDKQLSMMGDDDGDDEEEE